MKKIICLILVILLSCFMTNVYAIDNDLGKTSMYVWSISNIDYENFDKTINYLNIDTIYVGNYRDLNSDNHTKLFDYCKSHNIKIYMVYGEKEASLKDVKKLIDKVRVYNDSHTYQISGLAIDSEFHTTDEYRVASSSERIQIFRKYVDFMKEAYSYAKANNLKYVSCIPVSYDTISVDLLEELIRDGCDYIQVMNYNKAGMLTKIDKEVELSKKYNKPFENIGEFLEPGIHDVTDKISFYNDGLDVGTNKFKEIKNTFNYSNMKFCYHAYSSISILINDVTLPKPTTTTSTTTTTTTTKKPTTTISKETTTKKEETTTTSVVVEKEEVINTTKKEEITTTQKVNIVEQVVEVVPTNKDSYIIIFGIIGTIISSLYLIYQFKNN